LKRTVLSLMAHPDDAEFLCAGTLSRLQAAGWQVHIATMTAGDCGSKDLPPSEIADLRRAEAEKSVSLLAGVYHCLECRDVLIQYDEETLYRVIRVIREAKPSIVITHNPSDYMVDHENTSQLARTGVFGGGMPNLGYDANLGEILDWVPHLYYATPIEGRDRWGTAVPVDFHVDISEVISIKREMLACHASQRAWLRAQHGVDEYLDSMVRWAREQGQRCGVDYAEGFRQERGHAYPQENLLTQLLGPA